jgi:hypothetical protein
VVIIEPDPSELLHNGDVLGEYVSHWTGRSWSSRMERKLSALEQQAARALRRARKLPVGADRNDLRQLARGLLWLHRNGMDALMNQRSPSGLVARGADKEDAA